MPNYPEGANLSRIGGPLEPGFTSAEDQYIDLTCDADLLAERVASIAARMTVRVSDRPRVDCIDCGYVAAAIIKLAAAVDGLALCVSGAEKSAFDGLSVSRPEGA